ncbi:MAG: FecR domain-containing protein [Burkholderiales bacterium]
MGILLNRFAALTIASLCYFASTAQAAEPEWIYKTWPGDTLISIAGRYLSSPDDWPKLQSYNKIKNPNYLPAGLSIALPAKLMRQGPVSAKIVSLKGKVEATNAAGASRDLDTNATMSEGETLRTGDNSTAILQFVDGSQAFVLANSKMTLTQLRAYTTTGMVDTRMKLDAGRIETAVKPLIGSGARYEVQTPATQIGVRGTNFRIAADPSFGRTEVLEGKVATEAASQHVDLPAGFGSRTETGKPPAQPVELLAQPNLDKTPAEIQRLPVQIAWADVPKAVSYRTQVSADKTFSTLVSDTVFNTTEAKFADLPDGKYAVKVRAIDPVGLEGKDSVREFTVDARPEPPAAISEARSIMENERAEFKWNTAPALRSEKIPAYHFQLAADKDFSKLVADATATENVAAKSDLKPGEYYWRVASKLANGKEGRFGEPQMLLVKAMPPPPPPSPPPPPAPTLSAPAVGENMLFFNWTAPIAATKFEFQLARDAEFKNIVATNQTSDTRLYVPRPATGSEYFARVRLTTAENKTSDFSNAQKMQLPQR